MWNTIGGDHVHGVMDLSRIELFKTGQAQEDLDSVLCIRRHGVAFQVHCCQFGQWGDLCQFFIRRNAIVIDPQILQRDERGEIFQFGDVVVAYIQYSQGCLESKRARKV